MAAKESTRRPSRQERSLPAGSLEERRASLKIRFFWRNSRDRRAPRVACSLSRRDIFAPLAGIGPTGVKAAAFLSQERQLCLLRDPRWTWKAELRPALTLAATSVLPVSGRGLCTARCAIILFHCPAQGGEINSTRALCTPPTRVSWLCT